MWLTTWRSARSRATTDVIGHRVHFDVAVGDVEAAVRAAQEAGATLEGDIQEYPWGRMGTMSDPFGHGFCFVQLLGSGYDEVA